jgi:hypothetical protein
VNRLRFVCRGEVREEEGGVRKMRVVGKKERKGKKLPVLFPLPPSFEDESAVSYSRSALHRLPRRVGR